MRLTYVKGRRDRSVKAALAVVPLSFAIEPPALECSVMEAVLVINAGSSSLKFQVFSAAWAGEADCLLKGQIDGVGTRPRLRAQAADKTVLVDTVYDAAEVSDLPAATREVANWLRRTQSVELVAAGHRVVHGGPDYSEPVQVTNEVVEKLERYVSLAPLHQPNNLAPIRSLLARRPDLPQVACFDTAFHRQHGALADHFALPERYYDEGVRRYGFHGLSYEYIVQRLRQIAPEAAAGRTIVAHLGSGASMCAIAGGRSIESTLGFTALDGLPMGTRPGQLDPGVVLYLIGEKGMSAHAVQDLFYKECGLKGLSGISNDVRELEISTDPKAAFALEYFVYRAGLYAGMLAAALGGLDAFVFTAGIGENSASIRRRIAAKLAWLGVELNESIDPTSSPLISTKNSKIAVYVIPTNEELMIAQHTLQILGNIDREEDYIQAS